MVGMMGKGAATTSELKEAKQYEYAESSSGQKLGDRFSDQQLDVLRGIKDYPDQKKTTQTKRKR